MVGMTPWGVFFLACKLPYTKCWLLCQQAQSGTYPTGCESVSAVMVLQYYGMSMTPSQFIDQYLTKQGFTWENGVRIGPDPWQAFVGDPYSKSGYGCYAPVIIDALRKACPQNLHFMWMRTSRF